MKRSKNKALSTVSTIISGVIVISSASYGGKIITYINGGFRYGYRLFPLIIFLTISFIFIQEMNIRMAKITGKSFADLIREWYGAKPAFFAMIMVLISSIFLTISSFGASLIGVELMGVNKYIAILIISISIWLMITKRYYESAQNIFFLLSIIFIMYIISAIDVNNSSKVMIKSVQNIDFWQSDYIYYSLSIIGASIPTYMMFHLQSYLVQEDLSFKEYGEQKIGIYIGILIMFLISLLIMIVGIESFQRGGEIAISNKNLGVIFIKAFGKYAKYIFGMGILSFTTITLALIPLAGTLAICDAFALENGFEKSCKEAPLFYIIFTFILVISGIFVLLNQSSLINLIILAQALASMIVPVILIYMIIITNNSEIMGKEVNKPIQNIVVWFTVISIVVFFIALMIYKIMAMF
ncbi:Mn2+/Fe2+ NRAMP family transporter [Clostridium pascui]|uniref:NRAMP family divalent metal transporter n=1 Tax=Clostridium pascui TaxID=46609 RepID=UPI0019565186|nr:divalent metal cation transporter [Clostridium pascui]MBM7870278.1 Mn2+/Fe2+ NRAMP family transporter [Clostridium pascui]